MTTPQTPSPQETLANSGFTKDFEAYQSDLNEYSYLYSLSNKVSGNSKSNSLHNEYTSALDSINWKSKNPFLVYIQVMQLFLDPGTNLINNQVDLFGQENKCQSDLAKCQNDLQNITQESGKGSNGLIAEATGLDQMMDNLSGSQAQQVFPDSTGNLITNLQNVRSMIYVANSKSQYNPKETDAGVYFDTTPPQTNGQPTPNAAGKMSSFGQMIRKLSQQGDPDSAIEANTALTNAFNTNTSELEGLSAQSKEELTQWINTVKTLASAGSMFGHAISQVSSAAVQNMRQQ